MKRKMGYLTYINAGIRNKPGRNLATVFCFAFIAANIFSEQFLMAGATEGLGQGVSRMGADYLVVPIEYLASSRNTGPDNTLAIVRTDPSIYRVKSGIMDTIRNVQGVTAVSPQLYVATRDVPALSESPVDIYGIDPETDFTIESWLRHPLDHPLEPGEVIVGDGINGDVSSQITIADTTYRIAGRLDPTQSGVDRTVFMRMDDAYALAATAGFLPLSVPRIVPGEVNAVLVQARAGEDPVSLGNRIRRAFSPTLAPTFVTVIPRHFSLNPVSRDIQGLPGLLNIISWLVVAAALPLIALIAAMVAHEREREIGLLKSMGAKRNVVFFLVSAESLTLAAIGGITGVGLSAAAFSILGVQGVLSSALQVSFRMPSITGMGLMAGMALLVVIVIGSISSLYPAYRSSTMNPYDAIRRGG